MKTKSYLDVVMATCPSWGTEWVRHIGRVRQVADRWQTHVRRFGGDDVDVGASSRKRFIFMRIIRSPGGVAVTIGRVYGLILPRSRSGGHISVVAPSENSRQDIFQILYGRICGNARGSTPTLIHLTSGACKWGFPP